MTVCSTRLDLLADFSNLFRPTAYQFRKTSEFMQRTTGNLVPPAVALVLPARQFPELPPYQVFIQCSFFRSRVDDSRESGPCTGAFQNVHSERRWRIRQLTWLWPFAFLSMSALHCAHVRSLTEPIPLYNPNSLGYAAVMTLRPKCKIHGVALVCFCPACRGSARSARKARTSRNNGKLGGRPKKGKSNGN